MRVDLVVACARVSAALLANGVEGDAAGQGALSCMRGNGGVIDDLIVYHMHYQWYRMVVNAGTRDRISVAARAGEPFGVAVGPCTDLAMIAVQGECAPEAAQVLDDSVAHAALMLQPFFSVDAAPWFVARTGV
jgi:aminomethyltransferase